MKTVTIKTADGNEITIKNVETLTVNDNDTKIFDIKEKEDFWLIGSEGHISMTTYADNNEWCKKAKSFGNIFSTKELAKKAAKEIKLYLHLKEFARVVNEDWEPNWENLREWKYYCFYNAESKQWETECSLTWISPHRIYFKSKELAKRAISEIIIPFAKENYDE